MLRRPIEFLGWDGIDVDGNIPGRLQLGRRYLSVYVARPSLMCHDKQAKQNRC
jgi:hypothetical protein